MSSWGRSATDPLGCSWAGKAVVGMAQGTWSYVWINGDHWAQQQLYLHELGHNYNLGHAGAYMPSPTLSTSYANAMSPSSAASSTGGSGAPANATWLDHGDW